MAAEDDIKMETNVSFGASSVKNYKPHSSVTPILNFSNGTTINLGADMIDQYKEIFNYFDKDGSGGISRDEFKNAFKRYSMIVDQHELMELIGQVDQDNDGDVEWDEFVSLMREDLGFILTDDDIRSAFEEADLDNDGFLQAEDIKTFMATLGEEITLKDAEEMIETADQNHSSLLEYEEFEVMIMNAY